MAEQHVRVEQAGEIAVVRIDRPPANAMNVELLEQGIAVLEQLRADEPAAVVIAGRPGYFSAGVDLKEAPTLDADGQRAMVNGINGAFAGWYEFPRPVVCAVDGHAIAGGLILALCGDYRVGGPEGKLGLTELRAGVPYPVAAMGVVRAELSSPAARVLALRAQLIEMTEAFRLGVVDELVGAGEAEARAMDVASELAELPAEGYAAGKRQLRGDAIDAIRAVLDGEGDPLASSWIGAEGADAASSILRP
ncbi:MAG: enoyl-CoA hydratase/isomerase family protein [Thermoleophilaceae bacterium]